MASAFTSQFHPLPFPCRISTNVLELRTELGMVNGCLNCYRLKLRRGLMLSAVSASDVNGIRNDVDIVETASGDNVVKSQKPATRLQETISSLPPVVFLVKRSSGATFVIGLSFLVILSVVVVQVHAARKAAYNRPGSVADLIRRGQLRSDRRGISSPLKYEDPFNNPLIKVGKSNSTVEMCGKVYRLAPVTLTKEQQAIHQKRRSRAYQWKRPTIFLREGDSVPPDVDPDTVRWIPTNHPFATTASDIDEGLAQSNVYQKHGVPFRIQAEHEALQRKLEALQNEQKLNNLVIDPGTARDFERPLKSHLKMDDQGLHNPSNNRMISKPPKSDNPHNYIGGNSKSEEMQKP